MQSLRWLLPGLLAFNVIREYFFYTGQSKSVDPFRNSLWGAVQLGLPSESCLVINRERSKRPFSTLFDWNPICFLSFPLDNIGWNLFCIAPLEQQCILMEPLFLSRTFVLLDLFLVKWRSRTKPPQKHVHCFSLPASLTTPSWKKWFRLSWLCQNLPFFAKNP